MNAREWLLRSGRAAGLAAVLGVGLSQVFYALRNLPVGLDSNAGVDTRYIRLDELPKPEEFAWLVGSLAFIAILLTPLPRGEPRWAWATARAVCGALAVTLPLAAWDDTWGNGAPWFAWVAVGVPSLVALLLMAVPLDRRADEGAPPALPPEDGAEDHAT